MIGQNPVFIPGPTNIPDRLRNAMNVQTSDHRAPDFVQLFAPVLADLKKVFKTDAGQVLIFPASGTGGWEAAITNTLSPGDRCWLPATACSPTAGSTFAGATGWMSR